MAKKASLDRIPLLKAFEEAPMDAYFDEDVTAAVYDVSTSTVQKWRVTGRGPKFVRRGGVRREDKNGITRVFGARIQYQKRHMVDDLAQGQVVGSTSEADAVSRIDGVNSAGAGDQEDRDGDG